jgi:enoyl-CoA hydratase
MQFENLKYETFNKIAIITITRPEKHNAISLKTLDELHEVLEVCENDNSLRVLIITGAGGKAFASGSDLGEVKDRDLKKALEPLVQGIAARLERMSKPSIAAINGFCMGGGLEVALGCDLRIATPLSKFATPEGKIGIIPGGGATQRLPRLIGRAWAMEMLLMGETIDAKKACEIGLITRLAEPEKLMETAIKMGEKISSYAPLVPQFMKAMIHSGMEGSLTSGLALEKFAQGALCETEDKKEGLNAFLEKRTPKWKGK